MKVVHLLPNRDEQLLNDYLHQVDNDFAIPISHKVDITEYASRLLSAGHVAAVEDAGVCVSVVGFYCNDEQSRTAYLSFLSTLKAVRGRGCAKLLVNEAIKVSRQAGMLKICCDSVNHGAVSLYKSVGFKEIKCEKVAGLEKRFLEYNLI